MIYCLIVDFCLFFVCDISNKLSMILIIYNSFFMFYSMFDKFMTQWLKFAVFWQQPGRAEI